MSQTTLHPPDTQQPFRAEDLDRGPYEAHAQRHSAGRLRSAKKTLTGWKSASDCDELNNMADQPLMSMETTFNVSFDWRSIRLPADKIHLPVGFPDPLDESERTRGVMTG